jgi:hypothetical protein
MRYFSRRSFTIVRLTFALIGFCFFLVLLALVLLLQLIHNYRHFLDTYPFSTVPFWQDNRTNNGNVLVPIITIDQVNLTRSTIIISACCRNVARFIPAFQKNIRQISNLFSDYRIYLGESDSSDRTLSVLQKWQAKDSDHVRVYSEGQQHSFFYTRKSLMNLIYC